MALAAGCAAVLAPIVPGRHGWIHALSDLAGLRITRVEVRGNRHTQPSEITAALQLAASGTTPAVDAAFPLWLDLEEARRRIEELPWVRTAKLARILPDRLAVEITERQPALVWRRDDGDALVDMDGRELSRIARGSAAGLPIVAGEGAAASGPGLISLLRAHSGIERRMVEARRVEGRRWTLVLAAGTLLHLPGDGAAAALAWIEAHAASGLLDRGLEAIDLRVPGQLVVRAGPGPRRQASAAAAGAPRGAPP